MQEVVIDHVSRTLSKLFAWLGLILSLSVLAAYFFADRDMTYNLDMRVIGLCILAAILSPLSLYSLSANKPFLETSGDGLMAGALVRWYCPWSNLRDIAVVEVERRIGGGLLIPFPKAVFKELVIEVHVSDHVYFDNWLHRALRRWVVRDGGIILSLEKRTTMTKEQVCKLLYDRWQLAIDQTRESRA